MNNLIQDIRYSFRLLRQSPGFSAVALITIALGIAANTTIFSALNATVFHPFNFATQDRLFMLWEQNPELGMFRGSVSPGNFKDWSEQNQTFEKLSVISQGSFDLTEGDQPDRLFGYYVSPCFFDIFDAKPLFGRTFAPDEDQAGKNQVVVLKHSLWRSRFNSDPSVVNQTITLNQKKFTIVGVMPEDFNFPFNTGELWSPVVFKATDLEHRDWHYLQLIGLLKEDVTIDQAREDLKGIALRAQQQFPNTNSGRSVNIVPVTDDAARGAKMAVPVMFASVGFVLAIACANVANLLLVRSASRQKEIAVRLAVGASRWRLIKQLLTESLILALIGGALGWRLSVWGIEALARGIPESFSLYIPGWNHLRIDQTALLFTLIVSVLTGLIFGMIPALQATKTDFNQALKEGGRTGKGSRNRMRSALVVSEVALSMVLLIGAGLTIRSFIEIMRADIGIDPTNVLTMEVSLPLERYKGFEPPRRFFGELLDRISNLPGVKKAGATGVLPLSGFNNSNTIESIGPVVYPRDKQPIVNCAPVAADYFEAIGTRIIRGRDFTDRDDLNSLPVALVNEAFVREFLADQEPIGQHLKRGGKQVQIIGIVSNVMNEDFDERAMPAIYIPYAQDPWLGMSLVIRGNIDPAQLTAAVRSEVSAIDKTIPVFGVKPMRQVIDERMSPKRLMTFLLGIFAFIALVLAAVGLYAVMSYSVSQRTHEIGIRQALGASSSDILRLVIGQGFRLTVVGLVAGLGGSLLLTGAMKWMLYGITSTDTLTFVVVSLLLAAAAAAACYIPARRATRVDPIVALRCE